MKVLVHHIYEFKKGLRNLVLHTMKASERELAEKKLQNRGIDYLIQEVNADKINVFFGAKECVNVVREFADIKLNDLTPEQDFMLGTLLGYDRMQQCDRYLRLIGKQNELYTLKVVS